MYNTIIFRESPLYLWIQNPLSNIVRLQFNTKFESVKPIWLITWIEMEPDRIDQSCLTAGCPMHFDRVHLNVHYWRNLY